MTCNRISSYIFFDLETTGLPYQEKNRTKIIELSCVATSREFINAASRGDTPAVSKLTFVLNPQKNIHPKVVQLTGLSNNLLRYAPLFKEKCKSLITFIEDLPKPVCLVAHNGNTFDFKILLAECIDASYTLPNDLFCVDSLVGFRKIFKSLKNTDESSKDTMLFNKAKEHLKTIDTSQDSNSSHKIKNKTPVKSIHNDNTNNKSAISVELNCSDDLDTNDYFTEDEDDWPNLNVSLEEWQEIDELAQSLSDMSCEDFTEQSGKKQEIVQKKKQKKNMERSKAVNKLFVKAKTQKKTEDKQPKQKQSFTLTALYKTLLEKEPEVAHRAEEDCLMLLQCVVAMKEEFLPWADESCKLLSAIEPLRRH